MAETYNLKCPACGTELWYSQAKKTYRCPNPNCKRSPRYNDKVKKIEKGIEEEVEEVENGINY